MVFTFPIPLQIETAVEFSDSFGDSKTPVKDARAWLYQLLTKKGVEWVQTQGNGGIGLKTIDKDGKTKSDDVKLKDIPMKEWIPQSDPDWLPELWDADDVQTFEIKIGTSLIEKLRNVFGVAKFATCGTNESILEYTKNKDDIKPEQKESHQKDIKKMEEDYKKFKDSPLEKFLHGVVIGPILDKVAEHEKKLLEKEYDELYKEEDEAAAKKEKEKIAGKRPTKED